MSELPPASSSPAPADKKRTPSEAPRSKLVVQHPTALPAQVVPAFNGLLGAGPSEVTGSRAVWHEVHADKDALRNLADAWQVDAALVPPAWALNQFRLIAFDMDSTLITIECIDEIADFAGLKSQVAAITEATMRGEIADFNESLRRRVALLKGLPESVLHTVYEQRLRLSPGVETLLQGVRLAGLKTLLVSGGFTFFTERLKTRLNFDFTRANQLEIVDGRLTGQVLGDIVNADVKQQTVASTCAALQARSDQAIVVGDGANDLKMMSIAGLSVAYRAKPVVRAQTDQALNHCGLDAILNYFG